MTEDSAYPKSSPEALALSRSLCRLAGGVSAEDGLAYVNASAAAKATALASMHQEQDLGPVFNLTEAILDHGTAEQRDLIVVGFLEDVQNYVLRGDGDAHRILDALGPKSRQAWVAVEDAWRGDRLALDAFFETLGEDVPPSSNVDARTTSPGRPTAPGPG